MWTINDLSTYEILFGWMTTRRLSCPIVMERLKASTFKFGQKTYFYDCQRQFMPINYPSDKFLI